MDELADRVSENTRQITALKLKTEEILQLLSQIHHKVDRLKTVSGVLNPLYEQDSANEEGKNYFRIEKNCSLHCKF